MPSPEVVIDGPPRREVVGQKPPGAAAIEDVEDGVEDLVRAVNPGSSTGFRRGQVRFQAGSLSV